MKGKVQTVLGLIEPEQVGVTLTHEHLLHDLPKEVFRKPKPLPATLPQLTNVSFTLDNLGWIRQYPYSFEINNDFCDEATRSSVKEEMKFLKKCGGSTIVENSSVGLRARDHPKFMKALSAESGINIVLGTGFYVAGAQTAAMLSLTQEEMEMKMKEDIITGIDGTDVKCGVIGEIGCSWPLLPFEKTSLKASASVQEETGCPVIIHPGRDEMAPEEIIRIFQEAGGKVSHTVMSHLERTLMSPESMAQFASLGSFCELDLFGVEVSHYQQNENVDMPSDSQRITLIRHLVSEGYADKIVIGHDIHTKHRLMKFGGHGYSHILVNVVPKMLKRELTQDDIDKFLITNPRNWLTFQ